MITQEYLQRTKFERFLKEEKKRKKNNKTELEKIQTCGKERTTLICNIQYPYRITVYAVLGRGVERKQYQYRQDGNLICV